MALTIYGSPRSRTQRVLWMAAELGLDFEHIPLEFDDPALKSAEFLALNPAGAVPTIVDDEFALAESLAINLYLAKKYGSQPVRGSSMLIPRSSGTTWAWICQGISSKAMLAAMKRSLLLKKNSPSRLRA